MKILYSSGNRLGSISQAYRIMQNLKYHEIKVCGYDNLIGYKDHIEWSIESLYNPHKLSRKGEGEKIYGRKHIPFIDLELSKELLGDIEDWGPDLIISDYEPISANIGYKLGIEVWYCSPIHLIDGSKSSGLIKRYRSLMETDRKWISWLPPGRKLIYSFFGDLAIDIELESGYEWVRPYCIHGWGDGDEAIGIIDNEARGSELIKIMSCIRGKEISIFSRYPYKVSSIEIGDIRDEEIYKEYIGNCSWHFSLGETSYIGDAIYSGAGRICISPTLRDIEGLINGILIRHYKLGDDLGEVEKMGRYSIEEVERSLRGERRKKVLKKVLNKRLGDII